MALSIGEVARATGVTERALRYYEELGLLAPARDPGGRRRYDEDSLERLFRVRLLRSLGTPLADVDPDADDLLALCRRHLVALDERLGALARERERVRAVEARLLDGARPSDEALLDLLAGLPVDETAPTRRTTLLVYRDVAAAHAWLVEVFGFAPGPLVPAVGGGADDLHGEVHVGDGTVWLHREAPEHDMTSPLSTGGRVTASLVVGVDDVDTHHERTRAAGAAIDYPPVDQPYGVREYSVHDLEGHLWSFHAPLDGAGPDPTAHHQETT